MPSSTDQDDYTIYLSLDDARETPAWRIRDYMEQGCLSEAQKAELRDRFKLPAAIVDDLSLWVGNALDIKSHANHVAISRATAIKRGKARLSSALRWVGSARERAILREALEPLSTLFTQDPAEQALLRTAQELAHDETSPIEALVAAIRQLLEADGAAAEIRPADRRQVADRRRILVVESCCYAWADAGKTITFTTDAKALRDRRKGDLINLIQSVGQMITDPPITLKGETLRRDIERFKERLRDPDGLLGLPEFGAPKPGTAES